MQQDSWNIRSNCDTTTQLWECIMYRHQKPPSWLPPLSPQKKPKKMPAEQNTEATPRRGEKNMRYIRAAADIG